MHFIHAIRLLAVLSAVGAARPPVSGDLFDELHERIRAAEAQRQTIRARFTETTVSSLLVRPMISEGTLVGAKPARLKMTYTAPERKTIVLDGNRLFVTQAERREQVDVTTIMKRVDHYFVNATPSDLRKSFKVRAFIDPDLPALYQIDLVPTRKQIKQGLERLQIWVARDPLLLAQITITFAGGDTTTFKIEKAELNVPLPADAFAVEKSPMARR